MPKTLPKTNRTVPISEASKILGVSIDTIRRWDKDGTLHSTRPNGKNRFFSVEELENIKFAKPLSISETAQKLKISQSTLRRLEAKGLITPQRTTSGERVYDKKSVEGFLHSQYFIRQKAVEEKILEPIEDEEKIPGAAETNPGETREKVVNSIVHKNTSDVSGLKLFRNSIFLLVVGAAFIITLITAMFLISPKSTAKFFGFQFSTKINITSSNQSSSAVLGAKTQQDSEVEGSVLGTMLKPFADYSLRIVRQVSPSTYYEVVPQNTVIDTSSNDIFELVNGKIIPQFPIDLPQSTSTTIISTPSAVAFSIADGSITSAKLADDSVLSATIKDGEVKTSDIADNAVTTGKISNGTIKGEDIADGTISDSKLAQITSSNKVAGSAISLASGGGLTNNSGLSLLSTCTSSQILVWSGTAWACSDNEGGVTSLNSLTGGLTIAGAGINSVSASGTTVTITGTEADTLASVTGRGATTTTQLSLNGGVTSSSSTPISLSSTAPAISIGNTGTLSITDGSNILLSLADSGTNGTLTFNTLAATNIGAFTQTGNITGSGSPTISSFGTINSTTLSGGSVSGGSLTGGTYTGTSIAGTGSFTITGGTGSGETLTLVSTSNGTKGALQFFSSSNTIDSSGNLVAAGTITSGLINSQTISSAANFTGTVAAATSLTSPIIYGGSGTTSTLSLRSTSGTGATGADIIFGVGTNGGTEAMRIINSGNVGIGTTNPLAALQIGNNGAASQSAQLISGTWHTGGTATTTKPQLLIEPAGTLSNNWSTSGTGLGINAASGFAGNLLHLQVGSLNKVYLPANAGFNITNATSNGTLGTATTITTGDPNTKGLIVKGTLGTLTLTNNIIAYWKFDEGSGTVVEDIVGTNEGTTHGSSAWTSSGQINSAGAFAAANLNYTSVGNGAALNFTGSFSISTWVYPTAAGDATGFTGIVHKGQLLSGTSDPYSIFFLSNRKIRFQIDSSTAGKSIDSTTALSLNTWYHVVVVFDSSAGTVSIYLNGNSTPDTTGTTTITTLNTVATEVYIGASKFGSSPYRYFSGRIDETGIWTKALTTGEISTLYNSGTGLQYDFGIPPQAANLMEWQDSTGTALALVGPTGKVGIGATTPLATLDVRGNSGTTPVASVSGQTSFAALVVDNKGLGDIFTASSSGLARFVVKQNGNVGVGVTAPSTVFSALGSVSSADTNAIATITNNNTSDSANTIALRINLGTGVTTTNSRYATFYANVTSGDTGGTREGSIQSTNGGVAYNTGAADFAERFPVSEPTEPGDVIGIANGINTKATTNAQIVGVVSDTAGFVGNNKEDADPAINPIVGLLGQVKTKVSTENGPINVGDYITSSSTPGVGMKATKAGRVVGMALERFPASQGLALQGKVLVLVNPTWYDPDVYLTNTGDLNIAMTTDNSPQTTGSETMDYGLQTSAFKLLRTAVDGSQSTIDRMGAFATLTAANIKAGVIDAGEVKSDSVTAEKGAFGDIIGSAAVLDSLTISSGGQLVIKDENGEQVVQIDSSGNASFAGTINAKAIQVDKIAGLQVLTNEIVTNKIANLQSQLQQGQAIDLNTLNVLAASTFAFTQNVQAENGNTKVLTDLQVDKGVSVALDMAIFGKLTANGGIEVLGPAEFKGNTIFSALAEFFANVIFHSDVSFLGRPTFNSDTAGFAIIKKHEDKIYIAFDREYAQTPIINISITLDNNPDVIAQTSLEQEILNGDIKYIVTGKTTTGFTIKLNKTAPSDLKFSWSALSVKDAKTAISFAVPTPTPTLTPTPTFPPSPTPTPTPASLQSLTINENELGFLRVRTAPDISSEEVNQVNPGQTFNIMESQNNWYKIEYSNGQFGWVSADYVTIN